MIRAEDLKENLLNLRLGNEYIIYRTTRNNQKIFLQGVFLGETGLENELYIFQSNYGSNECFHKIDFLIGEYKIKEVCKKAKSMTGHLLSTIALG